MTFFLQLTNRIQEIDSLLCVGLDPHTQDLDVKSAEAAREFCFQLIDSTIEVACAYKPNIAFFEALGSEGLNALQDVIQAVPKGIPVILDSKRGDIASTAQAYSIAAFEILGADAVTINPYLGWDAVEPFAKNPEKGVFILCKTSNPGASVIQDLWVTKSEELEDQSYPRPLYQEVARLAQSWNRLDNLGLVVGATHPVILTEIRELAPQMWILAPGIGAQGGDLSSTLKAGLRPDGLGLLIPVSRGISRSPNPRKTAFKLRDAINFERKKLLRQQLIHRRTPEIFDPQLADALLEYGCIKFGQFKLKSGVQSPIYIDLRRLTGNPTLLSRVAKAYLPILDQLNFDRLAALPYAALPIATAITLQADCPMIYPRKEQKKYGTKAEIEGPYSPGEKVAVIDDLITTGGSKVEGIEKLRAVGLKVEDVVVLIDRRPTRRTINLEEQFKLHTVYTIDGLLEYWEKEQKISIVDIRATRKFLEES
ncbi:MAG: orotidine-5'-phosphate decarboxylase [Anaerolineales bacterium]|jgi:uridine monophosphate synthetase